MPIVARAALVLLFCSAGAVFAAEEPAPADDNAANNPAQEQPDITIIHRGQERVEEYKINNRVYMIKVTPAKGYSYYLVDTTGDGNFDTRRNSLDPKVVIPQWVLFKWK